MPDIFLSYNREDQTRAKLFADAFAAQGFDVWWDVGLKAGEAYDQVTERALREAKAVVVLWSKKSVESRWVRAEATLADRSGTLVPCMVEPCERPIMFELTQTAELAHWKGEDDDLAWRSFVADVRRFIEARPVQSSPIAAVNTLKDIAAEPAPAPSEPILAVLPFDNLSNDEEMQFFSDGVSEEILSRISRGSKLKIIGRTSSFQYRGANKSGAAAALNATHVLDGSIRRAGARVRVSAHLVKADDQTLLWSDRYDRGLEDIFAVQDEISEAIAEALNTAFFPPRSIPIDPAIYDLYLQARVVRFDSSISAPERIEKIEMVTRSAPDFAPGWVSLASWRGDQRYAVPYVEREIIRAQAEAELSRAFALDPTDPDNYAVKWLLLNPFGDFLAQENLVQSVVRTGKNGQYGAAIHALHLESTGRPSQAATIARAAHLLDPKNGFLAGLHGQTIWRAGRFAEGQAVMERTIAAQPDDHYTRAALALACAHGRDWDGLDAVLDPDVLSRHPLRELSGVRRLTTVMRQPTEENRRTVVGAIRRRAEETGHADASAFVYVAHMGFVDEAFEIAKNVSLGPGGTPGDFMGPNAYRTHLLFPAAYPELRNDPRFVTLCARLGLVEYWLATKKWPDCSDQVSYDFHAECERHRDYPKDNFGF